METCPPGQRGLSPATVQKLLGHSDIRLTMDIYDHFDLADTASVEQKAGKQDRAPDEASGPSAIEKAEGLLSFEIAVVVVVTPTEASQRIR